MLKIFIGYDPRQAMSYNVLSHSIISRAITVPVSISPIILSTVPMEREGGLTPFTFSRFLVPYLCNYKGWALFLDADEIVLDDIANLFDLVDDRYGVMVSKNERHAFEWASVMLFNNAKCSMLTPQYVEIAKRLHTIGWMPESMIGDLPREWNQLVGYDEPRSDAKLVHYTMGVPVWPETEMHEYAAEYRDEVRATLEIESWLELMGPSVHAAPTVQMMVDRGVSTPDIDEWIAANNNAKVA